MSAQRFSSLDQRGRMLDLMERLSEMHAERCIKFVESVLRRQNMSPPKFEVPAIGESLGPSTAESQQRARDFIFGG